MSAFLALHNSRGAFILTDAATYRDGRVIEFRDKTFRIPALPAAFTTIGPSIVGDVFRALFDHFSRGPDWQFDLIARSLPDLCRMVVDYLERENPGLERRYQSFTVVLAGISEVGGVPVVVTYQHIAWEEVTRRRYDPVKAGMMGNRIVPVFNRLMAQPLPDMVLDLHGYTMPEDADDFDPVRDGLQVMEVMRRHQFTGPDGSRFYGIGGHVLLTSITGTSSAPRVEQRIIHRWPNDRVGEPIQPDVLPFPGANRQQRRAAERAARRA